jgi:hypothetical protein
MENEWAGCAEAWQAVAAAYQTAADENTDTARAAAVAAREDALSSLPDRAWWGEVLRTAPTDVLTAIQEAESAIDAASAAWQQR